MGIHQVSILSKKTGPLVFYRPLNLFFLHFFSEFALRVVCELKLVKRTRPCLAATYGPFFNYVDQILPIIDHQFSVDILHIKVHIF